MAMQKFLKLPDKSSNLFLGSIYAHVDQLAESADLKSAKCEFESHRGYQILMSCKRKKEQLGMPWGTACGRLRKKLLFHLLSKCNMNICIRCNTSLLEEDFTIEHIQPWLGRDNNLFWDMNNIAFSHKKCNKPHFPSGGKKLKEIEKHGRSVGYANGCRCDECRIWKRNSRKKVGTVQGTNKS